MPFARKLFLFFVLISLKSSFCQNSMVGDGFGGRLWYKPSTYGVGSYTAYKLCKGNDCDSITNQLIGWGANSWSLLGLGLNNLGITQPLNIPGMINIKYFSSGYNTGVIKKDGTGWIWGYNFDSLPIQVISDVKFLDASVAAITFVKNNGTIWSIGDNTFGNFGDGTNISSFTTPVQMTGINNAVRVANGAATTYILMANGTVKAVGNNGGANANAVLLGTNSYYQSTNLPQDVIGLSNIVDIKSHASATAALDSSGNVYVWGSGNYIGDGDGSNEFIPKKILSLRNIVAISACADGNHFLALDVNKNCYAWGGGSGHFGASYNNNFQLSPVLVATEVVDIMAGETFSYVVKSDGSLWATGESLYGSIWLDLANTPKGLFTKLTPELMLGWCSLPNSSVNSTPSCSNINIGSITVNHSSGVAPYQYSLGNGTQNNNVFSNVGIGNYTVTITDANACVTTLETQISSMDPTVVVNNASVCFGETATLSASGANSYSWTSSGNLNTNIGATVLASPAFTSTYTVTGTSTNGCVDSAISIVTIVPLPIFNSINDTICKGEQVVLNSFGGINYTWSPSNGLNISNSASVIASPTTNTTYTLNADNGQCITTFTVHIQVKPKPIANFETNFTDNIELNSTLQLNNTSVLANSFEWQLCNNNISNNDTVSIALNYEGVCCIKLKAETNSCYDSITKCFNVYDPFTINIPNVFSPNNDGKNDFYFVTGTGIKSFHCDIFNRWGQKIYEWDGLDGIWDGKTKTGIANDGTYYYNIDCSLKDSNFKNFHGFLTLTR